MRPGGTTPPLASWVLGCASRDSAEELAWLCGYERDRGLANPANTQPHIQGSELTLLNINPICELLQPLKGSVLQRQSCRICMTQGNHRISEKSPGADPALMVYGKPEALLTMGIDSFGLKPPAALPKVPRSIPSTTRRLTTI